MRLLLATRNPHKQRELGELLADLPVEVRTLADCPHAPDVDEDCPTLEENAAKKASEVAAACGGFAMADDSGLFVDALDGRPGVLSARYAGPNPTSARLCARLVAELQDVPDQARTARFRCCIAMADPDGRIILTASGHVGGRILREMRGTGGFGYDPVFLYEPWGRTFAEVPPAEKNAVSHRAQALRAFRDGLERWLRGGNGR
ncbi:MAG: RdgB/HAM1 family non-canonical purine NTP pyrophosphatase [Candidatus Brocadiaceae bacterium]|nr:RdgB/HAM1 family non-canonical purine NTP pyrophosphatase [Candidatus Brocadiaceae bacterium]